MGSLNYDAYLGVGREGGTYINDKDKKAVTRGTYSAAGIGADIGYVATQSPNARVIIGLNDFVGILLYDKVGKLYKGDNLILARLNPNILGEVALTQSFFVFAGAENSISVQFGDGDGESDTHLTNISNNSGTQAYMGVRYQKLNYAIESQLSENPFGALAGQNILFNLSGFIYF